MQTQDCQLFDQNLAFVHKDLGNFDIMHIGLQVVFKPDTDLEMFCLTPTQLSCFHTNPQSLVSGLDT